MYSIPIMRPRLPSVERLVPYLKLMDECRVYSNFGPLVVTLEDRLAERYGLNQGTVATVANATVGLAIALAIQQPPVATLCVIPAWTFVASAHAAVMAGLVPYFVDVDAETWALDPHKLLDVIKRAPSPVGAVMPVMPFGSPIDMGAWEAFRARTGLAVAIDGAAGFDALIPSSIPSVVSLHATKIIGVGEGGFVASTDVSIRRAVCMRTNFGFDGSRLAQTTAYNAKLSEYQAAVGHAALDEWHQARAEWNDVAGAYRRALAGSNEISMQRGFGETWVSSTCVLSFGKPATNRIEQSMMDHNYEARRWWGNGAHTHPAMSSFPRTATPVTGSLARTTLAVPFYRDIRASDVSGVVDTLVSATY